MAKPKQPPITQLAVVATDDTGLLTVSTGGTHARGGAYLASWTLTWGDDAGEAGTGAPPTTLRHKYVQDGKYTIELTITDSRGLMAFSSLTSSIFINPPTPLPVPNSPPPNNPPTANLTLVQGVHLGDQFIVSTAGTSDSDGTIVSGTLNWGDGTTVPITGQPAATYTHTYAGIGNFSVTLNVLDNGGASATKTITVSVQSAGASSGVLTASDFTYIGVVRMPNNWTLGALGGMTGRTVAGKDRLLMYGVSHWYKMNGVVSAATSASSFTIDNVVASSGGALVPGFRINVVATSGNVFPQSTVIQSVTGTGPYVVTVSPALSATPAVGSYVWHDNDPIIEVEIPTSGITQNYTTTAQAPLVAVWPDPYRGKRVSWRDGSIHGAGVPVDPGFRFPGGLYFDESSQLLYWTYFDPYEGAGGLDRHDYALGASSLGAPSTAGGIDGTVTSYGPWRAACTDGDGTTFYGTWRFGYLTKKPSGSFMGGCLAHSGATLVAYGPSLFGGVFPTTATPGGPAASDLAFNDRYVNYYFPNPGTGNYFTPDGAPVGTIRQYQHTSPAGYSIVFEPNYFPVRNGVNPALNSGIATWNGVTEACFGAIWLQGPNKNCVLFASTLTTGPNPSSSDPNGPHVWYRSQGQYTIDVNTVAGFQNFEVVRGLTSGAQMVAADIVTAGAGGFSAKLAGAVTVGQEFQVGETVFGTTSGSLAVVSKCNRHDACYHGHTGYTGIEGITGDVFLRAFPAFAIYDGARMETNKAGSTTDYTTPVSEVIDLEATFGIQTAPLQNIGAAKQIWGFFYNPTTRRLYVSAPQADLTLGTNNPQTLVHIFEIRSGAL